MLEIEYKFREEDLIRYNELKYKNNEDYLKNIKRNRWIYPGLMGLISLYFWSYNQDIEQALYVLAIALLWMLVTPWVITWQMKQKVLMSYSEQEINDMFGDYRLFIDPKDPSFLQERSPSGKNKVEWKELLRVDYEKKQVHYVFDSGAALIIPTETVSKGSLEKFSEQVEKQIERHDD
jgi:hypothetical protein